MAAQKQEATSERGEGPIAVAFMNATAKDLKRVPTDVTGLAILDRKTKKTIELDVSKIPQNIQSALVAMALAQRVKTYVNNHVNADDKADVGKLVSTVYGDFLAGKIYSRTGDGKAPGRKFDYDSHVAAVRYALDVMVKNKVQVNGKAIQPMSEANAAKLKQKLEAFTPKERGDWVAKQKKQNSLFKKKLAELLASKIDTSDVGMIDL